MNQEFSYYKLCAAAKKCTARPRNFKIKTGADLILSQSEWEKAAKNVARGLTKSAVFIYPVVPKAYELLKYYLCPACFSYSSPLLLDAGRTENFLRSGLIPASRVRASSDFT